MKLRIDAQELEKAIQVVAISVGGDPYEEENPEEEIDVAKLIVQLNDWVLKEHQLRLEAEGEVYQLRELHQDALRQMSLLRER